MDPLYRALTLFRNRKYEKCTQLCSTILNAEPSNDAVQMLRLQSMTYSMKIDELDVEGNDGDLGMLAEAEGVWSEAVAAAPRPGTSLRNPLQTSTTALNRPLTSRMSRTPGTARLTSAGRLGTARLSRTARTPATARAMLATAHARAVRLGTASSTDRNTSTVIDVSRLDLSKYAKDGRLGKPLFEFLFYHEGDYRNAMELAVLAMQATDCKDWWWKVSLGRCYSMLGLVREAEQLFQSALLQHKRSDTPLRLSRVLCRLDQPTAALEVCRSAEKLFPGDIGLLVEQARLLEAMGDMQQSVKVFRNVAIQDAMNSEAIASIAVYHFYNDQPELALRYYRRVLAMGAYSAEVFCNVALCCLRSQHWDLTIACFRRALFLATEPAVLSGLWYNLSHLALSIGDVNLAIQCLRLCVGVDPSHAAALNNLAILEARRGRGNTARSLLAAAHSADPNMQEATNNLNNIKVF